MTARASDERTDGAGRHHLQADVAERGRLGRTGGDGAAGRIRGPLLQEAVARPAADDANLVEAAAGQLLERFEDRAVLERQAFENRAGEGDRRRPARAGRSSGSIPRSSPACSVGFRNGG